jgi:uncharacterized protein
MTDFKFGAVKIDPIAYGSQGSAILGIRDSGKTYTGTELAERVFEAGIPFTAFDPIGVWRFLRVPGHGRGYPVVVAGGQAGDLPLTVASAPEYVRAAMRDGVSLIIDLFDINLSKADWKRIVTACVRVMMHENSKHGLRHVFIEEAAEFAPQRVGPDQGQVYAEVEKLARMGGNSRLGYTLINQRAEEVNKAVLELCDNLFLHRQKGRNSLTALSKWLDIGAVKDHKEIIDSLSTLPTGECWAWLAATERPIRIKVPVKNSLHPDRRMMRGDGDIKLKASVDVGDFVTSMRSSLGKIEEEAKANDPAALRKQIAELQRQIKATPAAAAPVDTAALERSCYAGGFREGQQNIVDQLEVYYGSLESWSKGMPQPPVFKLDTPLPPVAVRFDRPPPKGTKLTVEYRAPAPPRRLEANLPRPRTSANGHALTLPPGERATLTALIQFPEGLTRNQLTVLTQYKRSSRDAYIQRLREKGLVETNGDTVKATAAGVDAIPDAEPLPTGAELREHWMRKLPSGEAKVLQVLIDAYPAAVSRDSLTESTGFARSSRDAYLQRMRAKQLWTEPSRGEVRASEDLF